MKQWRDDAACRGQEDLFGVIIDLTDRTRRGPKHRRERRVLEQRLAEWAALGREVCDTCPVVAECLEEAVRIREPNGMWGGLLPAERARFGRGRR